MGDTDNTVAVTGAADFLGSHICRALLHCGYAVRAVTHEGSNGKLPDDLSEQVELQSADVRNPESLNQAFQHAHAVVHSADIMTVDADPNGLADEVNLIGTRNVIQACIGTGVRRLVHISSVHAFSPLRGTTLSVSSKLGQNSKIPYVATKAEAHMSVLDAARGGLLNASIVCPSNLIGPGDSEPTPGGSMLLAMARKQLPCLINGGFWWSDVRDVANAIANAVEANGYGGEVYFTAGQYAKTSQLARLCSQVLGRNVKRPVIPYSLARATLPLIRSRAAKRSLSSLYSRNSLKLLHDCPAAVDESLAISQLGYESRPPEESIRDALNWFTEQGIRF
ncbi:MAG: SDR family NAD(P)-dependent oxidoreductase [Gemmatimonadetes bacterium]|nr:SDR family NAD(P)-dependent oxidoreductase [Gemmatimonadota bacterium]